MKQVQDNCVFCKIVSESASRRTAEVVYEDKNFLAFLDINPRAPGHVQVIPKKHYRWVWDVLKAGEYFEVVKKIAAAQQRAFNEENIWVRVTGDEVAHAHIWVFPNPRAAGDKKDFKTNAEKIRKALSL